MDAGVVVDDPLTDASQWTYIGFALQVVALSFAFLVGVLMKELVNQQNKGSISPRTLNRKITSSSSELQAAKSAAEKEPVSGNAKPAPALRKKHTDREEESPKIDPTTGLFKELHKLTCLVTRDFVSCWYHESISDNGDFPDAVQLSVFDVLQNFVVNLMDADMVGFLFFDACTIFRDLFRLFVDIRHDVQAEFPADFRDSQHYNVEQITRRESHLLRRMRVSNLLHPACISITDGGDNLGVETTNYLRLLVGEVAPQMLTESEHECAPLRYLFREILVCNVLTPALESVTPDLLNHLLLNQIKSQDEEETHCQEMDDTTTLDPELACHNEEDATTTTATSPTSQPSIAALEAEDSFDISSLSPLNANHQLGAAVARDGATVSPSEPTLFESVWGHEPITINVTEARVALTSKKGDPKPYVEYLVECRLLGQGQVAWSVYHRFSKFHGMHQKLKRAYPRLKLKLPSKKYFGSFDRQFVEKRRKDLNDYVVELTKLAATYTSPEVKAFFAPVDSSAGTSTFNGMPMEGSSFIVSSEHVAATPPPKRDPLSRSLSEKERAGEGSLASRVETRVFDVIKEIFQMHEMGIFRRKLIGIVRSVVRYSFLGQLYNLVQAVDTDESKLSQYEIIFKTVREIVWPNNEFFEPGEDFTDNEKQTLYEGTRKTIIESLPAPLLSLVGHDKCVRSIELLHEFLQYPRILHSLLLSLVDLLFVRVYGIPLDEVHDKYLRTRGRAKEVPRKALGEER